MNLSWWTWTWWETIVVGLLVFRCIGAELIAGGLAHYGKSVVILGESVLRRLERIEDLISRRV